MPLLTGGDVDVEAAWLNHDTDRFVCQAWGPLSTSVPVAPWTVECVEP